MTIPLCYSEEPRTVAMYKRHIEADKQQGAGLDHTLHHMLYLTGVSDGYVVLNKKREADGQKPLYCQPSSKTLDGSDYMKILGEALSQTKDPIADHLSVAEAMLLALKGEFRCPEQ